MSACPKGGEHQYRKTYEGGGWIEHTCRKCGDVIRRKQTPPAKPSFRDRVLAGLIIEPDTGCLLWNGYRVRGYGASSCDGTYKYVHRVMYEWFIGPIPDGLEIDHTCRVKHCAAPAHLEAVTHAENMRRVAGYTHNAAKTHCPQGHPYDEANTAIRYGRRTCRLCKSEYGRRRYAAQKAVAS